ncbi:hypothetical protein AC41_2775 [Escherichia coli 2-011-08_S3_C3]|nr:hypothetical protein AC41_2775 [Escherichia coli 2-011-08_S3_C3]KDS98546.1 hypothetical protein AB83_2955 [Escherichia coli 2-011-08_S3_C1]KEM71558.1 hypothetical protein AB95_3261 [Escherichia coli 7-233-03_S3_C1]KEN02619.1 hypothetical protein AC53_3170 [Escherichia coli 7-233-03_S3_C3]
MLIAFATVCNGLSPLARGTLSVGGSLDLRGGLSPLARGTQRPKYKSKSV